MTADEAQLVAVHVADPGHHPLIQERCRDGPVRSGGEVGRRPLSVPVVAEKIGAEVRDDGQVVFAVEDLQRAQVDTDGLHVLRFQDDPDSVVAVAPAAALRARQPPAALHLQVGVDAGRPDPDEQMLAPADHFADGLAGQIDRREGRHPHVAPGQRLANEPVAQVGGGVPDGVAFGHLRTIGSSRRRSSQARSRRPRGVLTNPASASAAATPARSSAGDGSRTDTPSTLSTRRPPMCPAPTSSASASAAARPASTSSVPKLSSERPPRSRNHTSSPSTRTTSAPALRPGLCGVSSSPAERLDGHGSADPYGLAGSAAASTTARYPGRSGSMLSWNDRSRSTVEAAANWAPPSDSTK